MFVRRTAFRGLLPPRARVGEAREKRARRMGRRRFGRMVTVSRKVAGACCQSCAGGIEAAQIDSDMRAIASTVYVFTANSRYLRRRYDNLGL
jgi:hypothetical protein